MIKLFFFLLGISSVVLLGSASKDYEDGKSSTYQDYNLKDKNFFEENIKNSSLFIVNDIPEQLNVENHQPHGRWTWAKVTAYTPGVESCGPYADGKTSIGVNTRSHNPNHVYGIAANPRVIPYGTKVYIEDYWNMLQNNVNLIPTEMVEVDDTGSAMRNFRPHWRNVNGERVYIEAHIDVRVRRVSTAREWGVKYIPIFIYE